MVVLRPEPLMYSSSGELLKNSLCSLPLSKSSSDTEASNRAMNGRQPIYERSVQAFYSGPNTCRKVWLARGSGRSVSLAWACVMSYRQTSMPIMYYKTRVHACRKIANVEKKCFDDNLPCYSELLLLLSPTSSAMNLCCFYFSLAPFSCFGTLHWFCLF